MTEQFEKGLAIRRQVMGDEFVDRAFEQATEFTMDLQHYITDVCWGGIWGREGLTKRDRSLINLAMLTALNRSQELRGHVRGAINNGVTVEEIKEVMLQTAVYCGAPAAQEGFRIAKEVLEDMNELK